MDPKFGRHLQVMNVSGREYILIHPANEALRELKGCIDSASSYMTDEFLIPWQKSSAYHRDQWLSA
jgi:Family of unknown function (DUF5675)